MNLADNGAIALSTTILSSPCTPADAAAQLRQLTAEHVSAFALDPRFAPAEQRALTQVLQEQGASVIEIGHPQRSDRGLPAASPASLDRDERREARIQLASSMRQACELGGVPVVLYPSWLQLSVGRGALAKRFAWGLPLALEALEEERSAAGVAAFDALCQVLDGALNEALGLGVSLLLPAPAPWPHQLPDAEELERLVDLFAGAPLQSYVFTDWMHRAQVLGRAWEPAGGAESAPSGLLVIGELQGALLLEQGRSAAREQPARAWSSGERVRVADACGLSGQLPLGCGELEWEASGAAGLLKGRLLVLTLRSGTSAAELERSLAWLARLTEEPSAQAEQAD